MAFKSKIHKIRYAPPPIELPVAGVSDPKDVCFIGRTNYEAPLEEKKFIFGIKRKDRKRHMYVVGKSGVGKTKFLELLIRQDIAYGHGLCVIDPHGDLMEAILDFIPKNRINDVIVIDPADILFPVSFNPLQNISDDLKHQVTQSLIEVMERQFGANWTPRLEHVFRFTSLALLDYPDATMRGMIEILTDRNYRQKVVNYIKDDMVKRFWAVEFADWSEKFDTEAIIPLVNKLGQFLSNPLLRNIFGQKENKIDIEYIMNNNKILLISLSKGKLGVENSSFFGSMFITKIYQGGMARASIAESERIEFYLYADEFQNLITTTFENLFSEARKYGVNMIVAHQYLSQLLPEVLATVLGNSGTIVIFRIGGGDAEKLEAEMVPIFKSQDMINLGMQEFYIKMTIDGEAFDPFSAETLSVIKPDHPSYKKQIIELSRKKYAVQLEEFKKIEEEKAKKEKEEESLNLKKQEQDNGKQATSNIEEKSVNNEEKKQKKDQEEASPLI